MTTLSLQTTDEITIAPLGSPPIIPQMRPPLLGKLRIPSGEKRKFVCLDPDTAGIVLHVRVNAGLGRGTLGMWKEVQRDWDSNATLGGARSVAGMYLRAIPFAQSPSCGHCDCGAAYCLTKANRNVVDYTLANVYGELLVAELDAFISSDFHLD